ncbi:MAG: PQQ-binding-like beta-propeller repeat protein, partial [Alphaproteobacteria bacterium]|nr:PQQ-binding-like beta-propeller repeat protein [Alphaproteobacteria bacterium]
MALFLSAWRGRLAASAACLGALILSGCQTPDAALSEAAISGAAVSEAAAIAAPIFSTPATTRAGAGPHPGEAVYKTQCAACHDNPEATRSPSRDNLKGMRFQFMSFALTEGKMKVQGAGLTANQRAEVINYLTGRDTSTLDEWTSDVMCGADRRAVDLGAPAEAVSTGFGFDRNNTRMLSAGEAGLTTAQLSSMELAWSIAFPDATTMRSQGAIVGKNLFYPATDIGQMYAFDISGAKPCIQWIYTAPGGAPLRSSAAYGVLADGTPLLAFSGLDSTVHAVDARTGKAVWTRGVASYSFSMTTGTPTVLKDRVIVPVAQYEISVAGDNKELCCNNHGYVLSLDPKTGAQQWRYDTMEDARPLRDRGDGKMYYGPSGAPIWNSPLVDEKRGLVYFGTGEANSQPTHRNTDALIAIGLGDGKEKWSFQATGRDIYTSGCGPTPKATQLNCVSDTVYRDVDFGASLILGTLKSGKDVLYAGQKSGTVWALEPDTGKVIFQRNIGTGTALGGIHWGIAFDNDTIYAPISNIGVALPGGPPIDPALKSGLYAVDATDGRIKWMFSPEPPPADPTAPPARPGRGWRGA